MNTDAIQQIITPFSKILEEENIPASTVFHHIEDKISFTLWEFDSEKPEFSIYKFSQNKSPLFLFTTFTPGQSTPLHQHDYIELMYVVQGDFSQNIAGKDFHFHKGDVVFVNHDIMHYDYLNVNGACVLFLAIPDSLFARLFTNSSHSPYKNFVADLLLEHRSDYTHLYGSLKPQPSSVDETQSDISIIEIIREIAKPAPGSTHIINGQLIRLMYHLALEYRFDLASYSQMDMRRLLFDEIRNDIQNDCRNITIEKLQDKYYYNRNYFNYLIKEQSGMTFQELRQSIRLEEAARLLLETNTNIDDIARLVGYENLGFFYRLFSARYGTTPRKYRLLNR